MTTLTLTLDEDRILYLNGQRVADRASLRDTVREAARNDPAIQAVVRADSAVPHGDVVEIIDLITLAGVRSYALTVQRKDNGAP